MNMLDIDIPALRRGRTAILSPCRLSLQEGLVLGIVGPNGAGKSTVLSAIAGLGPAPGNLPERAAAPCCQPIGHSIAGER